MITDMRLWYSCLILLLLTNTVGLGLIYHRLDALSAAFPIQLLQDNLKSQADTSAKLTSLQNLISESLPGNVPPQVLGISDILPDKSNPQLSATSRLLQSKAGQAKPTYAYQEQADFSAILGQLVPGYNYPYYLKQGDWYLVGLSDNKSGWVKAELVSPIE